MKNTPSGIPEILYEIEKAFDKLDRDNITPWAFFYTAHGARFKDFDGNPKEMGGGHLVFDGSVQKYYWELNVQPFIKDIIVRAFKMALAYGDGWGCDAGPAVEQVRLALEKGVRRTFMRMRKIDRGLRGRGYPERVEPHDIAIEMEPMLGFLGQFYHSAMQAAKAVAAGGQAEPDCSDLKGQWAALGGAKKGEADDLYDNRLKIIRKLVQRFRDADVRLSQRKAADLLGTSKTTVQQFWSATKYGLPYRKPAGRASR